MDVLVIISLYFLLNICLSALFWFFAKGEVPSRYRYFIGMLLFGVPLIFLLVLLGAGSRMMIMINVKRKDNDTKERV